MDWQSQFHGVRWPRPRQFQTLPPWQLLCENQSMPSTNPRTYDATPSRKVAFLGLGVMGYPMAGHLALAGHEVTVYNRTTAKSIAWCAEYASAKAPKHAQTPREAVAGAELVFCCVGNDDEIGRASWRERLYI